MITVHSLVCHSPSIARSTRCNSPHIYLTWLSGFLFAHHFTPTYGGMDTQSVHRDGHTVCTSQWAGWTHSLYIAVGWRKGLTFYHLHRSVWYSTCFPFRYVFVSFSTSSMSDCARHVDQCFTCLSATVANSNSRLFYCRLFCCRLFYCRLFYCRLPSKIKVFLMKATM
jgi:hypothetical protein